MVFLLELTAKDELAAERAASLLDSYLETLLGKGLLAFRIGRGADDLRRLMLFEEWTSVAAHVAHDEDSALATMLRELGPLLCAPANGTHYEIVAAGSAGDD